MSLNSVAELEKLYNSLLSLKGITGNITDIRFEDPEKYKNTLYKKLYDKAHEQATLLASFSKNTLGGLMSIEEEKASQDYFSDLIENLGSITRNIPFMNPFFQNSFQKTYEKKLIYKFVLN